MSSRDYYKVTYRSKNTNTDDLLDNDTEFNANQFKLYDDFTTDLRISYNPLRNGLMTDDLGRTSTDTKKSNDPNDSGVDMENGNQLDDPVASNDSDLLENEVMVDTWSSMDSSNSPLTDSGPSASDDCTPSTSSEPPRGPVDRFSPLTQQTSRLTEPEHKQTDPETSKLKFNKPHSRDLRLDLESLDSVPKFPRRPHFLDEDYQPPSKSNIECRIPKPHFLDHTPSPDDLDEKSDLANPNFLDEIIDGDDSTKKSGALPKKPQKTPTYPAPEERPRTNYRSTLHYGLESAARSSERDKRASQLYRGTWPGERDVWQGQDNTSVRSFSSNGSTDATRPSSNLENKMECVYSLLSLLTLSPDNNADLSGPLLEMSRSVESCIAMRQAGCLPLLVQLIHSKLPRETRDRAAKALRNIIHTQTDDKAGRREARVWRLLEQVREYCCTLEDIVECRNEGKEVVDDSTKHPSQSVAALMKLSFDEEHRHVVCQLGGLQTLAALVSGDQGAHGSRTDDNICLTMRKYAGMTLTNLTFGDGNNKSLLCSFKDFMLALVEQLESPNDDMRQVTAAVLRNLSWRADANSKQVLREVGAVRGLTEAAMTCQKEATLKSVLSALWNLTAHCSMNKVALCSVEGALGFLVDMLSYDSPTKTLAIVENAGGIMRNVSSHIAVREDYRQILRERNCLSVLLQHLKSPSLTVVSNSCGTLWNLSARCPQDQQFLWDNGAVPMLRSLIHSKHKMIAMGSSAALKNLLNSKPGKTHIISLDATARTMNLAPLPTLGARKQKALEQELDQNLAETCDNIEPATTPSTNNRDEKNLFTATERQIAMNLERHRMTSSSPLMGNLNSQISLSHSAHLASYLSCSNTLLKGALGARSTGGSSSNVNRSDSKDSVTSAQSDTVFEKVMRTGKVPVPTPRNKDLVKSEIQKTPGSSDGTFVRYTSQPPVPPPRSTTDIRTNYSESGYDVDHDSCDQPIDFSQKYSETKAAELHEASTESKQKVVKKKKDQGTFGDYQETDLDQPTDYSLRYAEHHSEACSDESDPPGPSINEDTIKHFATEGTPYETPIIFSTATSMSDLRIIGKDGKPKGPPIVKENPEVMTHSDEKDTCSIEEPPKHDNDLATSQNLELVQEKRSVFDTKFSSGMITPEKPVNYCDEGTPGCFSRVSSLSSIGEPTEEDCLAKRNAMATINVEPGFLDDAQNSSAKDKDGSKAVTFSEPAYSDTPLMFSRSSSLGSLPDCGGDDRGSVVSDKSRMPSGCMSPSEIPDSPGLASPRPRHMRTDLITPTNEAQDDEDNEPRSVFEERATTFLVENTPAHFSTATSLSSLTIDDEPKTTIRVSTRTEFNSSECFDDSRIEFETERRESGQSVDADMEAKNEQMKDPIVTDTCHVYTLEDTPAFSAADSPHRSAVVSPPFSAADSPPLSAVHSPPLSTVRSPPLSVAETVPVVDSSDSSHLSDDGLLEECIQKGIAQVVKNKGPSSDPGAAYLARDGPYRSLPVYLRSSTETVKMSRDFVRSVHEGSPPPPLPPRRGPDAAPPRPPPLVGSRLVTRHDRGRTHESRLPIKTQRNREKPRSNLVRNDSLSSLSLESFGSTDREIFEKTVHAGLCSLNTKRDEGKAHSVERPAEMYKQVRQHKSLDRSDKITQNKHKIKDPEFEKNLASGAYKVKPPKIKSLEYDFPNLHSKHDFGHNTRRSHRYFEDGPPSLPIKIEGRLERSNSLSSLSNDSFGSTDKEAFERCVRAGMSKGLANKNDEKMRVKSDDRLEIRDTHRSKQKGSRSKRTESEFTMNRTPYSYDHYGSFKSKGHGTRLMDGPPSLPSRMEPKLERSNSLSSLSNCSFGSTDKEVFERCVRMGMSKGRDEKRVRSDDRLESFRSRRRKPDGQSKPLPPTTVDKDQQDKQSKNVQPPSTARAPADGNEDYVRDIILTRSGSDDHHDSALEQSDLNTTNESMIDILEKPNEMPTVDSGNTTFESRDLEMNRSNEFLAQKSVNTTIDSEVKDELNRSNESYADVLDGSWSDVECPRNVETLTRKTTRHLEWTDIKMDKPREFDEPSKPSTDTWNDNTCPDDVTFPTISGSVHMVSSFKSEIVDASNALPDLLEKSGITSMSFSRPDLTNKLESDFLLDNVKSSQMLLENVQEPSFMSLADDGLRLDSMVSSAIEKEAARLAAQLKCSQFGMNTSVTSLNSLDLDNVKPPSNLGSLLSLTASGQWDEAQPSKKSQKDRKKSLPVSIMVKRALSNSLHQGSTENLDSNSISFLENVKPPSEMEHIDMESSMISVSSIASEVVEPREKPPIVFDFKQPINDFPMCSNLTVFQDLDKENPPSLFDELIESTVEIDQMTVHHFEDCYSNTLNVVTDIPSGSENCTPLPSDVSSVESTPKRQRNMKYLTPKEKRQASKDRYQTYTITDNISDNDVILEASTEEFLTWTKSESDSRSDEYITATSETKPKKRISAKQRRIDDRARYQTQTVDISSVLPHSSKMDPQIESLKQKLAEKKTIKQKRLEDAARFRTRTLSEDIPPSPTFVSKDANFENIETTTGYDSLSSNEPSHQQINDDRHDDTYCRDVDSGHNEDDFELNSTQMQTYTKSFRNYLPVIESPAAVDLCVVNNLKNIEMTASYKRALELAEETRNNPSSSDFASYEGDTNSEGKAHSDSEMERQSCRPKPKIIKPERRDESLESNESLDKEQDSPKGIRGRKKAVYISPYRRNMPSKTTTTTTQAPIKTIQKSNLKPLTNAKPQTSSKMPTTSKAASANTSPKKIPPRSPSKIVQKPTSIPLTAVKPAPLVRQGTFTKEESTVPTKDLPVPDKKTIPSRITKTSTSTKPVPNTSPSRLPQLNRFNRPQLKKANSNDSKQPPKKATKPTGMRNSLSNHSLQSNDSGKTVTIASRNSRQGSSSSVNLMPAAKKDIESKIAGLWKKVEQSKKLPNKPDKRVWIESDKPETPKLVRSSTFEGQPKQQVPAAPKQKTTIGIRTSQIPSLRPKTQGKPASQIPSVKKPSNSRIVVKNQVKGQT